jgi:hyperosmotically inducible periplasmic protein
MTYGKRLIACFAGAFALLSVACGDAPADGEIAVKVDQEIANSPVLGDAQIEVSARGGVVTLTGVVASEEQVENAERLAWSVEGVDAVESRLQVSPPAGAAEPPPVGAAPDPLEGEAR